MIEPELAIRQENAEIGFSVRLKAEKVAFEFEPNFGVGSFVKRQSTVKHRVLLDVDSYIRAPVEPSKMYFSDWIHQTHHIVKRDSRKFFGE